MNTNLSHIIEQHAETIGLTPNELEAVRLLVATIRATDLAERTGLSPERCRHIVYSMQGKVDNALRELAELRGVDRINKRALPARARTILWDAEYIAGVKIETWRDVLDNLDAIARVRGCGKTWVGFFREIATQKAVNA